MHKLTKIAAALGALLPASVLAQSIEGVVLNNQGNPVAGAKVAVEGTGATTQTNDQGQFTLEQLPVGINELHITKAGFAHLHQDITLANDEQKTLTFRVERSPIEVIDVVATPVHMSIMESASPVSVLGGESLRRKQTATLGDTLESVVGVHTNFHANVASTPIIRGLSGPRVLIAQNGLDVSDVSRVGPDHSVASEASTAEQIEVLRGPSTLFYGSGAIGGVVNVVDSRVPTDNDTRGEWLLEGNSVNDQKLASFNVTTGKDNIAVYADGFWRESDDYDIPVAPEVDHPDEDLRTVENTAEESNGFTVGASYLFDQGFLGVAVEQFNREYGIPGHMHEEEEGHDAEDADHDDHEDEHGEEAVYADLEQTRVQLLGEYNLNNDWLRKVNLRAGVTEYEHSEIEGGVVGTTFKNDTQELKVDLMHTAFADWNGGISLHYKNSETSAEGDEAFTPSSDSQTLAIAIMEEKHFGDVLVQLGARVERVTLSADDLTLPHIELHGHDEEHEEHEEEHHDEEESAGTFAVDEHFTPVSISAGLVWDFTPGYNIGVSISRSERAPAASELLSFGPHIATQTYEVGALYEFHEEDGEIHPELSDHAFDLETANNIDISLRKTKGDVGFVLNAFYNRVDNYFYQVNTGLFVEAGHEEHAGEEEADAHTDALPVYLFQADDVILHGFEAQVAWQVTDEFKAVFMSDYVRARLQDGGDLPRTPPLRVGTQFSYQTERLSAHLDITRYQTQDRVAAEETATDGYTLVDASVSYDLPIANQDIALYLKGTNLTDTEARVHSSFLKDVAPRPGRSIAFGVRGYF